MYKGGNKMNFKKLLSAATAAIMLITCTGIPAIADEPEDTTPAYLNTSLTFEERAADLVSRMTLEEKAAQLGYQAPAIERLGVSAYNYWKECLHGVARQGKATNYPASLALSNTWNRELIHKIADETSTEARAKNSRYNLSYYTPTINMARDPRWGRNEETYGEDPYLTGQLGAEFVKGMQGDDDKYTKIIATIKHFAANNNEKNRRGGSSYMTEFNFRNYYTKVFQNVAEQVMPGSVMSSYNATSISRNGSYIYNFKPSSSNPYLLTDLLRRSWGFDGYVTTDCGAGNDLAKVSQYKIGALGSDSLPTEAYVAEAIKSGMDLECNLSGGNTSAAYAVKAVENGYMTEEQLETAIYHMFLERFRTGEFDSAATTYRGYTSADIESAEHIATAEEAAEESWVLLKNDGNILPLKNVTNVAVVGDLANKLVLGDYTGTPENTVTPIEGIKAELGNDVNVKHVGVVADDEKLYNVKSITLVRSSGGNTKLDLSKAESVSGMTLENGELKNVTPKAGAVIKNVNFQNVTSVKVEMATGDMWGGSLNIAYGQGGPTVASVNSAKTANSDTYTECVGEYTGADGGYNGTVDMYISASAAVKEFTVDNFKSELDAADVIIAYAGTIPKQEGFGTADSSESHDRDSINLPSHQAHVQAICNAYPDKTVVVMSTVGQINVEPFKDKCKAILWTSYNGQTQGTALGKILAGDVNPSGRLTTTWYANSDVQKMELFNNTDKTIDGITGKFTNYNIQKDGTNPGHTYMYYGGDVVYPFGYGLSYTDFTYSDMTVDKTETTANGKITASVKVKNTSGSDNEIENGYSAALSYADGNVTIKSNATGTADIIHATYNGKTLERVEVLQNKQLTGGETVSYPVSNVSDGDQIMLWDSLKTMQPLTKAYTVGSVSAGGADGEEVVQLYVSHPTNSLGANTPAKQLKGFEKIELAAGEEKTVTFELDVKDLAMFDEATQKDVVPAGEYTIYIGKNANDISNSAKVTVFGTLDSSLKTVKAMPDGITVCGLVENDGTGLTAKTKIDPSVSAVMSDETVASDFDVVLTSSDETVAKAENGKIVSGYKEGTALITASVTINGVTKTDKFPVVNSLEVKPSAAEIAAAKAELKAAYDSYPQNAYSTGNYAELTKLYNDALAACDNAVNDSKTVLDELVSNAKTKMTRVVPDLIEEAYTISSENSKILVNGVIDYRAGGIEPYSGNTGTITNKNPKTGVKLIAKDDSDNAVDGVVWSIKKLDASGRSVADIDSSTGELTIYGNGVVEITASDMANLKCAKQVVYINTQIEGEYADNGNGANLADAQKNTSNDLDVGSSGTNWIEYKGVKLSMLEGITLRHSHKNKDVTVNISLDKSTAANKLIATGTVAQTGAWNSWRETTLDVNTDVIDSATLDEYDCATIYIQTNGANLDYFKLNYTEYNDEVPYVINNVTNKQGGKMIADIKYRGSETATEVKLVAEVLNADTTVKSTSNTAVTGAGEYEITIGASDGETVCLTVKDGENSLSESVEKVYRTPAESTIVAYYRDSTDGYNYNVLLGGSAGVQYGTVNGLSGYGALNDSTRKGSYTYTDFNGKTSSYSFQNVWKTSGKGTATNENLFFTPTSECKVTVVFDGNGGGTGRTVTIYQSAAKTVTGSALEGNGKGDASVSLDNITDTTAPVYIYGSSGTSNICAIIVEYYGAGGTFSTSSLSSVNADVDVMTADWYGTDDAVLTKNPATGETKVWQTVIGNQRVQLPTDTFYETDVPYTYGDTFNINSIAAYKDRLYAGCDDGLVIVFTSCIKCYKLKKVCDFDIKEMEITDGVMTVSDGAQEKTIDMSDIGGDSIEADEALALYDNGAVLVDVRTPEELAAKSYDGSVNIPLSELEEGLADYDKDTVLIFFCASGGRAETALKKAKEMGFANVYNLGSVDKLL